MRKLETVALLLLLVGGLAAMLPKAGMAATCCECRGCPDGVSACTSAPGTDRRTYEEEICRPLGCLTATCIDRGCDRGSNRCPASEAGQCQDRADNDADGAVDCADSDCAAEAGCQGGGDGGSTCCVGREDLPGCDDAACEACVCAQDEFCCTAVWDVQCASRAVEQCADLCPCGGEPATPGPTGVPPATPTPDADGSATPEATVAPAQCATDEDCPSGATCSNGVCARATATPSSGAEGDGGDGGGGCAVARPGSGIGAGLVVLGVLLLSVTRRTRGWYRT